MTTHVDDLNALLNPLRSTDQTTGYHGTNASVPRRAHPRDLRGRGSRGLGILTRLLGTQFASPPLSSKGASVINDERPGGSPSTKFLKVAELDRATDELHCVGCGVASAQGLKVFSRTGFGNAELVGDLFACAAHR